MIRENSAVGAKLLPQTSYCTNIFPDFLTCIGAVTWTGWGLAKFRLPGKVGRTGSGHPLRESLSGKTNARAGQPCRKYKNNNNKMRIKCKRVSLRVQNLYSSALGIFSPWSPSPLPRNHGRIIYETPAGFSISPRDVGILKLDPGTANSISLQTFF